MTRHRCPSNRIFTGRSKILFGSATILLCSLMLVSCEASLSDAQFDDVRPLDSNIPYDARIDAIANDSSPNDGGSDATVAHDASDSGSDAGSPTGCNGDPDCIECVEMPPSPSRAYTVGQQICTINDNAIYVGILNGVYYLWRRPNGDGAPDFDDGNGGREATPINQTAGCFRSFHGSENDDWRRDVDVFQEAPLGMHVRTGWRPAYADSTIVRRTYRSGDLICTWAAGGGRPVRAQRRNGEWHVEVTEIDKPGPPVCRISNTLIANAIGPSDCMEPGGTPYTRFVLDSCFPSFNGYMCQ